MLSKLVGLKMILIGMLSFSLVVATACAAEETKDAPAVAPKAPAAAPAAATKAPAAAPMYRNYKGRFRFCVKRFGRVLVPLSSGSAALGASFLGSGQPVDDN